MLTPLLLLAMHPALPSSDSLRGSVLYSQCKTYIALIDHTKTIDVRAASDAAMCAGYIEGYVRAGNIVLDGFCIPEDWDTRTKVQAYLVYMDANPKMLEMPRNLGLYYSLKLASPCEAPKYAAYEEANPKAVLHTDPKLLLLSIVQPS